MFKVGETYTSQEVHVKAKKYKVVKRTKTMIIFCDDYGAIIRKQIKRTTSGSTLEITRISLTGAYLFSEPYQRRENGKR